MYSNKERSVDYKLRAGCICYKSNDENQVLLISSRKHKNEWRIPAGGIEPGEEELSAAVREVTEEAGVKGRPGHKIGIFIDSIRKLKTNLFVLYVEEELSGSDWLEYNSRRRKWFNIDEAIAILSHNTKLYQYLNVAKHMAQTKYQSFPKQLTYFENGTPLEKNNTVISENIENSKDISQVT